MVLDFVGATWRFGPIAGPTALGADVEASYQWEEACGSASSARAMLSRCKCGVLLHRAELRCAACGVDQRGAVAAARAARDAAHAAAAQVAAQGSQWPLTNGRRALAAAPAARYAQPLGRSKHAALATSAKPRQPLGEMQNHANALQAPGTASEEAAPRKLHPASPSLPAGWAKVWHERRQRHVLIHEETGEVRVEF